MSGTRGHLQAANCDGAEPRDWFTCAELADLALPGLPADKRSLNRRAREERWTQRSGPDGGALARPRSGRGGGVEFHVSLLPGAARIELAQRGLCLARPEPGPAESPEAAAWRWFDAQSARVKAEAHRRMDAVREIELLEHSGMTRSAAIAEVARAQGQSPSTLWNWWRLAEGIAASDRLPALAPRRKGGGREAEIDPYLWSLFKSDVLRPSKPTMTSCYARVATIATERGLSLPSEAAFRRRFKREVPQSVMVLRREGPEALRRSVPAQRRTVDHLNALDLVNIDGHKFDVFVTPPDGGKPVRPLMVAIQDIYSSKVLSWSIDLSENAIQTQLAFRDLFRDWGIPKAVLLDNGRAFASKQISGGAATRFRFKIRPDEPTGVLTALDINPVWALPYRGQSKPVERAFRDMCDRIARHPATEGAYTGNSPANKPHNYGSRAMEWDAFVAHVAKGIAAHNAQTGRRGRHYNGRSFDEVFAESYERATIRKATPEQLRLALLTAEQKRVNKQTSEIALFGNRYWDPALSEFAGEKVLIRFDPENLHSEIHAYTLDGRYLMALPVINDSGFDSAAGARIAAKRVADYRKRTREQEQALMLLTAEEVAERQAEVPDAPVPEARVVRAVRHRGQTAAALKIDEIPRPNEGQDKVFGVLRIVRPPE